MSYAVRILQAEAYQLPVAGTWYRIDLPPQLTKFRIQPRGQTTVRVRFDRGAETDQTLPALAASVADVDRYHTLAGVPGQYIESHLTSGSTDPRRIFVSSPDANAVVEILVSI